MQKTKQKYNAVLAAEPELTDARAGMSLTPGKQKWLRGQNWPKNGCENFALKIHTVIYGCRSQFF